jgi:hypothetical protein
MPLMGLKSDRTDTELTPRDRDRFEHNFFERLEYFISKVWRKHPCWDIEVSREFI